MVAPAVLRISALLWNEIRDHLLTCLPEEGCGLIGGRMGFDAAVAELVLPVPNLLKSPVRFRMAPQAQLRAMYALEDRGLDLIAIYHSHPTGPAGPSEIDLEEFTYPGVVSLIVSPARAALEWQMQAFWINNRTIKSIPLEVLGQV